MTEFPITPIGEVCAVIAGQSPPGDAYNDQGDGLPFYQGKKDFTDRYLAFPSTWTTHVTKRAGPGDIVMSVRAPVGPINEVREEICIGRGLAAIRNGEDIDRDYLWYALSWLQPEIAGSDGAVFPSINKSQIEALEIPLPPLDEQKRIVAALDQAFAALDRSRVNAEANLFSAQELFKQTLDREFAAIADGVSSVSLQDAVHPECGLSYGIVQPGDELENGLPIVRPVDLTQREVSLAGLKCIAPEMASGYARTTLHGGELLLSVRGSTGTVSVAASELVGTNVTRGIVPIRFDESRVMRDFAYFQFLSGAIRTQIAEKTYGAALMQINIKDLRAIRLLVPGIEVQRQIVRRAEKLLEASVALRRGYEDRLADIAALRQSLFQSAFSGQLT